MVSLDTTSAIKTLAINLAGKANRKTIVAGMEELISDGLLAVGSKLPTSKELSGMLGVSGGTLQAAMHELTDRGYISRSSRKGTFVTNPRQNSPENHLRSNQICLLGSFGLRPDKSAFGNAYLFNMLHQAKKYGYEVVLEKSEHFMEADGAALKEYIDMRAIVALSPDEEMSKKLADLAAKDANVLIISGKIPGTHAGCVYTNNEDICYNVTKEILALGHKKICFLVPEKLNRRVSYPLRFAGCRRALEEAGLEPPLLIECMSFDDVAAVFSKQNHPTAILDVGVSDILYMLERLGKHVPDNISLVRYDANGEKTLDGLEISSIEQPLEEMIELAMRLLPKLSDGGFSLELPHKFIRGETLIPFK